MKATRPEIKVLFTSGYTNDSIVQHGALDYGVEFIENLYSPADLLERVREVLAH